MHIEIKNRWLEALRGGSYVQTKGVLERTVPTHHSDDPQENDPVGFCCLGVLCHLASQDGIIQRFENGETAIYGIEDRDASEAELPYAVAEWAGLEATNPQVRVPGFGNETLARLNDTGSTFAEIADLIATSL